ncbi:MAG: N-acetylneuraminate synthase family protein [Halobacteriovoraceae bacterium]|nr:N-acetylneuraminate synthase family protein [Halobacteriovoraceae bacterium]
MSVYIVAEIGNTHEGSLGLAKQFVKAAADCGVNAVKFQTHLFDYESLPDAPNPPYFKDETRKQYFERTALSLEDYKKLKKFANEECGVDFFSSPFSLEAVDFLEQVGVEIYKVASGEVTNLPLLARLGQTGKKVILSSGMSSWKELDEAVECLRASGCQNLTVLQCVSEYPCAPEHSGLNIIPEIKKRYQCEVGYSDHTLGMAVSLGAVALGATFIEKHFTLSKKMYGSDAKNSTEPEEFKLFVDEIRNLEIALTHKVDKDLTANELKEMKFIFEKTIVAKSDLQAGTLLNESNIAFKKPMKGIPANQFKEIMGKKLNKNVKANHVFEQSDLSS